MAQGQGIQSKLSFEARRQLERLSKSTLIDLLVLQAREQLGNADELPLLGLVDQWLEPVYPLRKMRPLFLQQKFTAARVVRQEQQYQLPKKKPRKQVSRKLRKE